MLQVNLLGDAAIKAPRLKQVIEKALKDMRARSFSGRNPELGRMINCPVCERRHRETQIMKSHPKFGGRQVVKCVQVFKKDELDTPFISINPTRHRGRGHRKYPHHSSLLLQLVQRTQKLFKENEQYFTSAKDCMEESRDMAARELKVERRRDRRNARRAQQTSRRINAGLEKSGARKQVLGPVRINLKTYHERKAKLAARTKANIKAGVANESV